MVDTGLVGPFKVVRTTLVDMSRFGVAELIGYD
jgi:hypothetical protein